MTCRALATALALTALTDAVSAEPPCTRYRVTPLAGPDCTSGAAASITEDGRVAGWIRITLPSQPEQSRIFRWSAGEGMVLLPMPGGASQGHGASISDAGTVSAIVYGGAFTGARAVRWDTDDVPAVLPVPDGVEVSEPGRAAADGVIPGRIETIGAVLWSGGGFLPLGTIGAVASARDHSTDIIVGTAHGLTQQAVRWRSGGPAETLPVPGTGNAWAMDVNASGRIVGAYHLAGAGSPRRAVRWDDGVPENLHVDGPYLHSSASACNDAGWTVGSLWYPAIDGAAAWDPAGRLVLLSQRLHPDDHDWTIVDAADINAGGKIVGTGTRSGYHGPVLLTPVAHESADLDGNGRVDFMDLLVLLGSWGLTSDEDPFAPPPSADIDCSGTVDLADLLRLLALWG
ncbi:MAG: hypothetical protein KF817_04630 [Phycisphaeraceae bacterium]|nr:hypothetical protein [Phycisphaeraceae bacterium]